MISFIVLASDLLHLCVEYWFIALPLALFGMGEYNGNNSEREH